MASVFESEAKLCSDVHELESALMFVTGECKLTHPVSVTYMLIDGEGFIKIEALEGEQVQNG